MLARMERRQFNEWMAAYELDPWGPERLENQLALIAAVFSFQNREEPPTVDELVAMASNFTPKPGFETPVVDIDELEIDHDLAAAEAAAEQQKLASLNVTRRL